jgi:hypothetical protein
LYFEAVEAMEGQTYGVLGRMISLSEQQIVDCVLDGCSGGFETSAYDFMRTGVEGEQTYPVKKTERAIASRMFIKRKKPICFIPNENQSILQSLIGTV